MNKKALSAVKKHWKLESAAYQKRHNILTNRVHGLTDIIEKDLKLLGKIEGKKIIELGCGGGQNSIALAKKGAICTGVDLSQEQLKFAENLAKENNVKINFLEGDVQNLDMIKSNRYSKTVLTIGYLFINSASYSSKTISFNLDWLGALYKRPGMGSKLNALLPSSTKYTIMRSLAKLKTG